MAHRRLVSESNALTHRRSRPLSILSPITNFGSSHFSEADLPLQFEAIILQLEDRKSKVYYEGYLQKLDMPQGNGSNAETSQWQDIYASLSGTVLSTWQAADLDLADTIGGSTKIPPVFVNLMDALIEDGPDDISITVSGNKQIRLRTSPGAEDQEIRRWVLAVHLAAYERSRMQEAYTANLYLKFSIKDTSAVPASEEKWSGYVDARICGGNVAQTQWTKFWCLVVSPSKSKLSLAKRLSSGSEGRTSSAVHFFTEKRSKRPTVTMDGVFAAYACFPEHISLIETAGVIKLEGSVLQGQSGGRSNGFALIIPTSPERTKRLSFSPVTSKSPSLVQNILKFLYAVWLTYDLYNLPTALLLNNDHINALGFAHAAVNMNLEDILDKSPEEEPRSAQAWRSVLRKQEMLQPGQTPPTVTASKQAVFKRSGNDRRVVSEGAIRPPSHRPLVTSIDEDEMLSQSRRPLVTSLEEDEMLFNSHRPLVTSLEEDEQQDRERQKTAATTNHQTVLVPDIEQPPFEPRERGLLREKSSRSLQSSEKPIPFYTPNHHGQITQPLRRKQSTLFLRQSKDSITPDSNDDADIRNLGPSLSFRHVLPVSPSLESPSVPNMRFDSSDEASLFTESSGLQPTRARPMTLGRASSHNSYLSGRSVSVYSAQLDDSVLDLVYQASASDAKDIQDGPATREGSIYSITDDTDSLYGEKDMEQAHKRASAASLLDIQRQPMLTKLDNPYTRPRQRLRDDNVLEKPSKTETQNVE